MTINPLALIITGVGIFLLVKLRFFPLCHPIRSIKETVGALSVRENFRSFTLALAGTLGVGNIFGVALGIMIGGKGSIFWLLISVFFSSVLKYSEVTLSADSKRHGGIYHVIKDTFGRGLSKVYAFFTLLLGFFMGGALQCHTFVSSVGELFDTPPIISVVFMGVLVFFGICFGRKIVAKITEIIIPLSTMVYILITLSIIILNFSRIPSLALDILGDAFRAESCIGGFLGFLFSKKVKEGYARGILSNEAGAGTSTVAHSTSFATPREKGLLGALEVFFDTAVLCLLTGLSILLVLPDISSYDGAMSLVIDAVSLSLGDAFLPPLLISIFIFAYSTVICWFFYSSSMLDNLGVSGKFLVPAYIAATVLGSLLPEGFLVLVTDVSLFVLTLITSITLIKNSDRIKTLSEI